MKKRKPTARYQRLKLPAIVRRIVGNRPAITPFRDLPTEAKYAIIHYMCINGEAWSEVAHEIFKKCHLQQPKTGSREYRCRDIHTNKLLPLTHVLDAVIPIADEFYGDLPFGYAEIPTNVLTASVMHDEHVVEHGFNNFDDCHAEFAATEQLPNHRRTKRWPAILSSQDEHKETLQDGWHRFHSYYEAGDKTIPVVFYAY